MVGGDHPASCKLFPRQTYDSWGLPVCLTVGGGEFWVCRYAGVRCWCVQMGKRWNDTTVFPRLIVEEGRDRRPEVDRSLSASLGPWYIYYTCLAVGVGTVVLTPEIAVALWGQSLRQDRHTITGFPTMTMTMMMMIFVFSGGRAVRIAGTLPASLREVHQAQQHQDPSQGRRDHAHAPGTVFLPKDKDAFFFTDRRDAPQNVRHRGVSILRTIPRLEDTCFKEQACMRVLNRRDDCM